MSKWVSAAAARYNGPCSHLTPSETTLGKRFAPGLMPALPGALRVAAPDSSGLPIEYCTPTCTPPGSVGEARSIAFARRKLKLEPDELAPEPILRITLFGDTKLPLETPRKPSVSPYFLNGVSMLPSLTVPQPVSRPANESRLAKEVVEVALSLAFPSSILTVCSSWPIALNPPPRFLLPRKPR